MSRETCCTYTGNDTGGVRCPRATRPGWTTCGRHYSAGRATTEPCRASHSRIPVPSSIHSADHFHGRGRMPCPRCGKIVSVRPRGNVGTIPAHKTDRSQNR